MSYTENITCPHCGEEMVLEVTPTFDEPDDIEIKVVKEGGDKDATIRDQEG